MRSGDSPKKQVRFTKFSMAIAILFTLIASSTQAAWLEEDQHIMGTKVHVELWANDEKEGHQAIAAVMNEMRRIDQLMSPLIDSSDVALLNHFAAQRPVTITDEVFQLIKKARFYSEKSNGAFDITFASIGHRYDYRKGIWPTDNVVNKILPLVDFHHLKLNQRHSIVAYHRNGVKIDLGGIAKGYAVDQATALLRQRGVRAAIVNAGGDSRLIGDKRGRPWMIGIKHPRKPKEMIAIIPLVDTAYSTSGDYERFFIADGIRYHHIIDPKTGRPATASQSVTIIGPKATDTDALSTTVFILGPEKGMALVDRIPNIEAIIVDKKGRLLYSNGFSDRTNSQ